MYTITLFSTVDSRPNWRYLINRIHVDGIDIGTPQQGIGNVMPIAGMWRELMKTGSTLRFAILTGSPTGTTENSSAPSFGTSFSGYSKQGLRPLSGELFYRDVVRFKAYPSSGRTAAFWLHGLLDTDDILENHNGERYSTVARQLSEVWRDWSFGYSTEILNHIAVAAHGAEFGAVMKTRYPCPVLTSHYTDAHAVTRWRRRLKGKVADAGDVVFSFLELAFDSYETNAYWLGLGIRIAPGIQWSKSVAALTGPKQVYQAVKQASEAGDSYSGAGGAPPDLRFSIAWGEILRKWQERANYADTGLQDLLATAPPHYESGGQYISSNLLELYQAELRKMLESVSVSALADWYNPKSYAGQLTNAEIKRLPDIIELAF